MNSQATRCRHGRHPDPRLFAAVAAAAAAVHLDALATRCLLHAFARAAGLRVQPRILGKLADAALLAHGGAASRALHRAAA